ncbi:hypothetical protein VHUM_00711 [Vanrija humicola]|uniref:Zn(2)-C6 fungal-type domain-containing protein n=1 Tax=Vanrija humicola TaxID=5417 RepID=A0A7D8V147_VANHU|nr:hypothetical protein VHUM_00711 [Vanrija humicola]
MLANLAALSNIPHDDDEPVEEGAEGIEVDKEAEEAPLVLDEAEQDYSSLLIPPSEPLAGEQGEEFVLDIGPIPTGDGQDLQGEEEVALRVESEGDVSEDDESRPTTPGVSGERRDRWVDGDYRPRLYYEGGKLKRRRNRTVLSCTECHKHCDRNIPCSRCIKRGVPSMCRMDTPTIPQRKRRKPNDEVPVNYELGLRVQALESLIRSGGTVDADAASAAAMETIMHATRAANNGQPEAAHALQQLSQSAAAGLGIGGMSQDAQSSLLLDVLQQSETQQPDDGSVSEMRATWSAVPAAPAESSLQVEQAFEEDQAAQKLNIALPVLLDDSGKAYLPPTVKYAEKKLREESLFSYETLPVEGYTPFLESGTKFAYGEDSQAIKRNHVAAIQAMSTTGGLRLAATFLSRFPVVTTAQRSIYIPNPTTDEDVAVLRDAGLDIKMFRFHDLKTGMVDWEGMRDDLQQAPARSVVLLHVSGSIPTGAELTAAQWRLLTALLQERRLIPLVVMAFQGLTTGDAGRDAQPLRFMVHENLPVVLVQSFEAMMGLYTDSPAIVSVPTLSIEDRDRIDSQLRNIARSMYARPSAWGALLANAVLSDTKLYAAWLGEIKAQFERLRSVREKLFELLANKLKTPGTWSYLKRISGMYCSILLPQAQLDALTSKRNIHILPDGCISLGCFNNSQKIDMFARALDYVVREGIREAEEQQAQALAMELALQAAKEQQEREEAEATAAAAAAEAAAAQAEDALLMEASIQNAIDAQRVEEEEESRREEEARLLEEQVRKAAERAEIARQAELILATIE